MKHTILIADDDTNIQHLLKSLLESSGYKVVLADNGVEALEKARKIKPSLILLDIHMPEKDGLETCRELKSESATSQIPIIMLTVAGTMEEVETALGFGATSYVTKPCAKEKILEIVNNALQPKNPPTNWMRTAREKR